MGSHTEAAASAAQAPSPRLRPIVFSTDATEPQGRFETWRGQFLDVNEIIVPKACEPSFSASSEQWRLGPILFGVNRTPDRRLLRSAAHCARDDIDHWVLRVCRTGRAVVVGRDSATVAGPGQLIVGNLADGYDYVWGAGEWVAAILPRDAFPTVSAALSGIGAGPLGGAGPGMLADYLISLGGRLSQCTAEDLPVLTDTTRAMILSCLGAETGRRLAAPADVAVMQRLRIERLIRRNIASARLDAGRICTLAGISRSALYRLFEPDGGVAAYVQRLRLDLVSNDLADPSLAAEPISRLAERRGFHCIPSFNRIFRRVYGCTPGEARHGSASVTVPGAERARSAGGTAPRSLIELMR